MNGKALYPGEDQWCAVQGRDWVQVGDRHHHAGKSHNQECGGYPPWGDDTNNKTYGNSTWNDVLLYMEGGAGGGGGGGGGGGESELWLRAQDGDLVVEGSGCDEVNGVYKPSSEGNYNGHSWWWKDGVHYRDGSRYGNPENFQVWHNGGQVR